MKEKPFKDAIFMRTNDLPDGMIQEIMELTEKVLINTLVDLKQKKERNPNVALAALQRSLGLVIAKVFPKEEVDRILDATFVALRASAKEWGDNEQ